MIVPRRAIQITQGVLRRNYGISAVLYAKASDPIQQLFADKAREYGVKSKGKKFVDSTPEIERELKEELSKAARQYASGDADMNKFPDFKFEDPKIDPIEAGAK